MTNELLVNFVIVSLASAAIGAVLEYVWHATHHDHKKGHR